MSTIEIVKEAIGALKDRTGSSVIAMNKWIETEKKVSRFEPSTARSHFRVLRRKHAFFPQDLSICPKWGRGYIDPHLVS
jgi:hypothetical protein